MSNFDAFDYEQAKANEPKDVFYGEIVMHRGYQGIRVNDLNPDMKGWMEYDPNDDFYKSALVTPTPNGKARKVHTIYEFQHFPIGAGFETYPIQAPSWSDDWQMFRDSVKQATGKDGSDLYTFFRAMTNGGKFFEYETPVTRTYQSNGETKKVRGVKVLRVFASQKECQDAYDEAHGIDGTADKAAGDATINALPKEQAMGFVVTLAMQAKDLDDLQLKFDTMPMLAALSVEDEEVMQAAYKANTSLEVPF